MPLITLMTLFVAAFSPGLLLLAVRVFKNRLGFKGKTLYFRDHKMCVQEVPVDEIVYTRRNICCQNLIVVLFDGKGKPFYSEKTLNFLLEGLLVPAKKLNGLQMSLYQLKYKQPIIVAVTVFIVIAVALMKAQLIFKP